ncbi:MAG: transcription antiterminator [Clostridia bacterium]|jgi:transcriptional antiterminator NusG|nr:transcription antiterminator [Clostridia bacterium]
MSWYALFVKTGEEEKVRNWIYTQTIAEQCNCIVPKRKIKERKSGREYEVTRILFPGYVFINIDMDFEHYYKIKSIPKILKILGCGSYFTEIQPNEMTPILRLIKEDGIIDYSNVIIENSIVTVKSGPLKGMEVQIKKIDKRKERAQVLLNFMGVPTLVHLGVKVIMNTQ